MEANAEDETEKQTNKQKKKIKYVSIIHQLSDNSHKLFLGLLHMWLSNSYGSLMFDKIDS